MLVTSSMEGAPQAEIFWPNKYTSVVARVCSRRLPLNRPPNFTSFLCFPTQSVFPPSQKVLLALCTHRPDFMASPENLPHVLELFTSSLLTCHVSARVMRLQCLSRLAASFTPGNDAQAQFLPAATLEVVLCTKDSNGRTRELAYSVLVLLAIARGNPADTLKTVVGGLAASTPHARSAAVLALGHLQLEFGHFRSEKWDARVAGMVPELTCTMLILLKEPSREVVKAVLGWLRVGVGGADRELLRPMVPDIVSGVMSGTTPRHKVKHGIGSALGRCISDHPRYVGRWSTYTGQFS